MKHEPQPVAILAARIMRAYPSLSAYSAASLATELCAIERAQQRHAERCCNGADGGYTRRVTSMLGSKLATVEHDPDAEQRAGALVWHKVGNWLRRCGELSGTHPNSSTIRLQDDPRGRVLLLQLPGEAEPA
jgi:hypothetical protein